MRKRMLQSIAAAGLSICLFSGCSVPFTQEAEKNGAEGMDMSGEGTTQAERETLVVGLQTDSFITDYEDNYMTKKIEDDLNVNLEIYELPSAGKDVQTKVSLMATNGEDIPDILITSALTTEAVFDYGNKGIFLPLNEYLQRENTNFSNIEEKDKEMMLKAITMADGNIYALPKFVDNLWNYTPNRLYINTAWLEKLNMDIPKTTDELYEVLKSFHDNDPNGNGLQDELGIYGYTAGGYGEDIVDTLMNAFVFYNGSKKNNGLSLDETGENVIAPFTTEGWKKGLEYMHMLYEEGLFAPSVFTDDLSQFRATLNSETNVVGLTSAGSTANWTDCDNNANFLDMSMIPPLTGPEGICYTPNEGISSSPAFMITSQCKNPELAFQVGDWFMDPEHSRIARYGEKGVDWTDDPEICSQNTNAYLKAGLVDSINCVWMTNIWSEPSNKFWRNINPYYESMDNVNRVASGVTPFDETAKSGMLYAYNLEWYSEKHPEHMLETLHYSMEESEVCTEIMMNVDEFVEQSKAEFITGERDLETGWETYLSELKNLGLDTWLEIAQTAYEREQ